MSSSHPPAEEGAALQTRTKGQTEVHRPADVGRSATAGETLKSSDISDAEGFYLPFKNNYFQRIEIYNA